MESSLNGADQNQSGPASRNQTKQETKQTERLILIVLVFIMDSRQSGRCRGDGEIKSQGRFERNQQLPAATRMEQVCAGNRTITLELLLIRV